MMLMVLTMKIEDLKWVKKARNKKKLKDFPRLTFSAVWGFWSSIIGIIICEPF